MAGWMERLKEVFGRRDLKSATYTLRGQVLLCAGILMTACAEQTYQRPAVDVPSEWLQASPPQGVVAGAADGQAWWYRFGDANLNTFIEQVLQRNNDLAVAALNVRRAQLLAERAGDPLIYGAESELQKVHSRRLDDRTWERSDSSTTQLRASFTLDLWGRLDQERNMASWALAASQADRETVYLNVIGTTADLYWRLAYYNQRVASAEKSLETAVRTQRLINAQSVAGAASGLEKREAEQTVLTQRSSLAQLRQSQIETRNAFATLFNTAPDKQEMELILASEPDQLPSGPLPEIQEGLPSSLLSRRPDLRAAEFNLRASLANIDVVRSSFYPTLALTGALGNSSSSLSRLLANPVATLGTGLTLPFLDVKSMKTDTAVAGLAYQKAVVEFRSALYNAYRDVENALSAKRQLSEQAVLQAQNLVAAREAERLYAIRYRAGAVALRLWLDAQERLREAELQQAQVRLNQLQNLNTLYQALGGGGDLTTLEKLSQVSSADGLSPHP
ncbi:efflux transporter outer membrane subunit [Pseudomonas sp. COR18]|uniref:efflux transporter outer membrane subunit n=1 Tax=Pseudomonas sp. COR18 TaxID=3399680 RepID=UPI003B0062AA